MPQINIVEGTYAIPDTNIELRRFSRVRRQRHFNVTVQGDGIDEQYMAGTVGYAGSFVGIAAEGWQAHDHRSGTITVSYANGTTETYSVIVTNLQDVGSHGTGGPVVVTGQWVGTLTSS